ncbi:MAG: acetyl-CoA synthetase [Candidatus Paceibacteria bacterium]|jgi:acetyl-CoA synthetase
MKNHYHIQSPEAYTEACREAETSPSAFWDSIARENFEWMKPWDTVLEHDLSIPKVTWFRGAKLNITVNCIDRHLATRGSKTALLFEPNDPTAPSIPISYQELHTRVCKMANVLRSKGIQKGDRVCLYLPMIPELAIAVLACARIGAVHSVVFAGFSSTALATRINDCDCKMVITSDGSYRGAKTIDLKGIVDVALLDCKGVTTVLVVQRIASEITLVADRDYWMEPLLALAPEICAPEVMDAEDPLFILYTSGSTGKPKGMVHTTAGYMVYSAFSFQNVFQYQEDDVYWCTADIGWVTGHSYIVYGPLANGATSLMFEGVPTYPDAGRFWEVVAKHKVNQFYTAPTAIRALAKESLALVEKHDLSSLKVLGTVGEPINEEAWHWYDDHIGKNNAPIVDTWWQTETGGIMITSLPGITKAIPTYATKPLPGIRLALMDDAGQEVTHPEAQGKLCISYPWPSMARTIYGNHQRYKETYFSTFENVYFTGDGALRDAKGNYRITGRVDDVIIVSGHNLGTAPIEDAINQHPLVAESAVVGFSHDIKGTALYGYLTLKNAAGKNEDELRQEINGMISLEIGPIAKLNKIQFTQGLPKTRSGKIMRRILRKIAEKETDNLGDISTLLNPEVVQHIIDNAL